MALVNGNNCGFVTSAPVSDPSAGQDGWMSTRARALKATSPATAGKITEIGWWCDNATEESNFEVGLYDDDGNSFPGNFPKDLLHSDKTNAKGTTAGWKSVAVDWEISEETIYWITIQLDETTTTTEIDYDSTNNMAYVYKTAATLPDPSWDSDSTSEANDAALAIYAVWEAGEPTEPEGSGVNVDDSWLGLTDVKVNVDDAWKEVTAAKINIDDAWKEVDITT